MYKANYKSMMHPVFGHLVLATLSEAQLKYLLLEKKQQFISITDKGKEELFSSEELLEAVAATSDKKYLQRLKTLTNNNEVKDAIHYKLTGQPAYAPKAAEAEPVVDKMEVVKKPHKKK